MKSPPSPATESLPISFSVLVVIADARKSTRVFEAGREQSFAATPEALAALPGHLNALVRGVGADAQRELNRLLAELTQPVPPAAEPPPASLSPATCSPSPVCAPTPSPPNLVQADDYLLPLNLSLPGMLP